MQSNLLLLGLVQDPKASKYVIRIYMTSSYMKYDGIGVSHDVTKFFFFFFVNSPTARVECCLLHLDNNQ